ncbi:disulfide bond formation protein B [Candidiatus Paracoxiella cheracis]|uniref:disulfide bond formation protein B n=1 Tax=Candidiatus Paracoxiella cheracis TaxID=3405120 RepID=UPI003BF517EF
MRCNCKISRHYGLYFAWVIALIATMVSLYFSVVKEWPVCDLCWYQRICIYPLVIILGIAAFRENHGIVKYALPLAVLGFLFSLYQYLEQMVVGFAPISLCGVSGPDCSHIHFQWLGFITFPFLGALGSLAIIVFLVLAACAHKKNPE